MNLNGIPPELIALPQWVCYGAEGTRPGDKGYKMPYNPLTGHGAKAGQPDTWTTFPKACAGVRSERYTGIGFEFAEGGGIVGIDFDHCRNPDTGELSPWAAAWVDKLNSYTEISPSGTGLHIICFGQLPGKAIKRPQAEMYDSGRYFTVTGDICGKQRPVSRNDGAIAALYAELVEDYRKSRETPHNAIPERSATSPVSLEDQQVIDIARRAKNGQMFERLFQGDWQDFHKSQSEADLALCNLLAFYAGGDAAQVDRLFRASGLMREKWDERHGGQTYGEITIGKAVADLKGVYAPSPRAEQGLGPPEEAFSEKADKNKTPPQKLESVAAIELQKMQLPPVQFIVNGLLPVGLGLLASPPKYGKSWMVLDMGLSVAAGRPFLGHQTTRGGCLYLALEDSLNRLKDRMNKILLEDVAPIGFDYAVKALDLSNGLLEQLDAYLKEKPETRLIIIDTLQKIRGQTGGKENAYATDYREMSLLKSFADRHSICILLVHHLRKMADDGDPFNRISGTSAMFGAPDVAMVLSREKRDDVQTTFSYEGRDIEGGSTVLEFDKEAFHWKILGDADWLAEERQRLAYQKDPIVLTIKKLLERNPAGWSGTASELLDAGKTLMATYLATTPRDLSNKLSALDKPLFDYDGIVHTRAKHGGAGGKHHFMPPVTGVEYEQTVITPI